MTKKSYKRLKIDQETILDAEHLNEQQAKVAVLKEMFGMTDEDLQAILRDPEVLAEAERLGPKKLWKKYVNKEIAQKLLAASRVVRKRG